MAAYFAARSRFISRVADSATKPSMVEGGKRRVHLLEVDERQPRNVLLPPKRAVDGEGRHLALGVAW